MPNWSKKQRMRMDRPMSGDSKDDKKKLTGKFIRKRKLSGGHKPDDRDFSFYGKGNKVRDR